MKLLGSFLIVTILFSVGVGCQKPADIDAVNSPPEKAAMSGSANPKLRHLATEQGGSRVNKSKTQTLHLTSIAVDCTSAITFTSEEPSTKGTVFMSDACNRLADVTISIEGKDEDLEFVRSSDNAGRESIEYANDRYRVLVQLGVKLSKQRQKDTICVPVNEVGAVRVVHGDETLDVPSMIERWCPYEEGE